MAMDIKEVRELTRQVDGFLSDEEGQLLYELARNCSGSGVIVEIGSWKGRSTIWLAEGSKAGNNVKVYAIDPHTGSSGKGKKEACTFEEFKKNIEDAKVSDIVVPLVVKSEEAARDFKEPVELCFIDGAHEYEFVRLDFDLWFPKLVDHGTIVFHDTGSWSGPKKVADDCVLKSKYFKDCGSVDSIIFAEKVKLNSIKDRLRNRYTLFVKDVSEPAFRFKSYLPKPVRAAGKKLLRAVQLQNKVNAGRANY